MKVSVRRVEKLRGRSASRTGLDTLEPTAGLPALEPDRSVLEASRVVYSVVPGKKKCRPDCRRGSLIRGRWRYARGGGGIGLRGRPRRRRRRPLHGRRDRIREIDGVDGAVRVAAGAVGRAAGVGLLAACGATACGVGRAVMVERSGWEGRVTTAAGGADGRCTGRGAAGLMVEAREAGGSLRVNDWDSVVRPGAEGRIVEEPTAGYRQER